MCKVDSKKYELAFFLCLYCVTVGTILMSNVLHHHDGIMFMVNRGGIKDDGLNLELTDFEHVRALY